MSWRRFIGPLLMVKKFNNVESRVIQRERSSPQTVYPSDPTERQLQSIDELLGLTSHSLDDYAKPEMAAILLDRHRLTLVELMTAKARNHDLETSVNQLRTALDRRTIDLAIATERNSNLWMEIPIGILSGFAINLLTGEHPPIFAWVVLIICVVVLIYIRYSSIVSLLQKSSREDQNGKN